MSRPAAVLPEDLPLLFSERGLDGRRAPEDASDLEWLYDMQRLRIRRPQQPHLFRTSLELPYLQQANCQHERLRRTSRRRILLTLHVCWVLGLNLSRSRDVSLPSRGTLGRSAQPTRVSRERPKHLRTSGGVLAPGSLGGAPSRR